MIRNIKKLISVNVDKFNFKSKYQNNFKQSLVLNLNKIKSKLSLFKQIHKNEINYQNSKKIIEPIKQIAQVEKIENFPIIKKLPTIEFVKPKENDEIKDKKFLKKKLNRKLSRLKRKIKRYKFTKSNVVDNNINMSDQGKTPLEELNSKVSNLQSELKKIQSQENTNIGDTELKKLKNKYKRKIKKLKNKINKYSKIKSNSNVIQIIKEQDNKENEIQLYQETVKDSDYSEYEKRIEEYQKENTSLKNKIHEFENNNQSIDTEKNKIKELEEKLKHYQEENVRLSNQIFNQDKKIEIMKNQISNFENLKQKLYEQVNNLGDTLLDNDNVENIFDGNSNSEETSKKQKTKVANSIEEISETIPNHEDKNINKTSSNNFDTGDLDQDIKNIFSN